MPKRLLISFAAATRRIAAVSVVPALTLVAIVLAISPAIGSADPTSGQMSAAFTSAGRSVELWATINICKHPPSHKDRVGIRGQMPGLSSPSWLWMVIQVQYYSNTTGHWKSIPRAQRVIAVGHYTNGLHQRGVTFPFTPQTPVLVRGVITFEWRRAGKIIKKAVRITHSGYSQVDFGDPPGYSAATCKIS